ncbi:MULTISPECIES: type IV pilin N-terminal domain-containing protein [unclassified Methanoculleus]|uniref:type IV pilin N-terminal domain-containing protein n=1 Tax=unclassified Methanoculleus TaxID=2619537 RepID=UPI0025F31125|nr:type IV pilin N-terminal domain-containing protein [Methanoculleus sp. UBA377]
MKEQHVAEDAVSPVIGVMLMLVVTIIIAAVVSGFAGELAGTQEKTPQASIAVKTGYVGDNFDISFEHQGGDPIRTKECQFITFLTLPNGTVIKHVQTPTSPLAAGGTGPGGVYFYSRGPHLTDPQKYAYPCNPENNATIPSGSSNWTIVGFNETGQEVANPAWFGEAVWLPGDVARTYHNGYTANFVGLIADPYPRDDVAYDAGIAALTESVQTNSKLEIKLLHVPSGKYILDRTITLQG